MAQPVNKNGGSSQSSLSTVSDVSSSAHDSAASTIENLSMSKNGSSASLKGKNGKAPLKGKNVKVVGSRYLQANLRKEHEKSSNRSCGNNSLSDSAGKPPNRASLKSARPLSETQMKKIRSRAPTNVKGSGAKLHSTALNATTFLSTPVKKETTDAPFSTTIVGDIRHDNIIAELHLPDISAIKPENSSGSMTIVSKFEDPVQGSVVEEQNLNDVELEYLQYLNSATLDMKSDAMYLQEIKECQNQIMFLKEMESKTLEEVHELDARLELARMKSMVECSYQAQMEKLGSVMDCLPKAEKALDALGKNLEKTQYQARMQGFHIPEDKENYWDEFVEKIEDIHEDLSKITLCKAPMNGQLHQAKDIMEEVENEVQHMNKLETHIQKAAILAIQDASLKIGAHQTERL